MRIYSGLIVVFVFASCTKTIEIVPEFEHANYAGVVKCINEYGEYIDNSGVLISIDGLENISTLSDDTGYFELKVPIGNYSINYTKEGLGNYVHDRFNFIGGIIPVIYTDARLYAPVDVKLIENSIVYDSIENVIQINAITKCTTPYSLGIVSKYDLNSDYLRYWRVGVEKDSLNVENIFNYGIGFLEGNLDGHKTVYMAFYATNYYDWGYHTHESSYGTYSTFKQLTEFVKIEIP